MRSSSYEAIHEKLSIREFLSRAIDYAAVGAFTGLVGGAIGGLAGFYLAGASGITSMAGFTDSLGPELQFITVASSLLPWAAWIAALKKDEILNKLGEEIKKKTSPPGIAQESQL